MAYHMRDYCYVIRRFFLQLHFGKKVMPLHLDLVFS